MFRFGVFLTALATVGVLAGYPEGSSTNNLSVGESTSNAFGYGYSGTFSGGSPPNFPPFNFQGFLNSYLESINKYHQEFIKKGGGQFSYSHASSSPNGNAQASSSIVYNNNYGLQAATAQAAQGGFVPSAGGVGGAGAYSGSSGGAGAFGDGSGAAFGGSFSAPSNFNYQTPNHGGAPSVLSRFGGVDAPNGGAALASAAIGPNGVQQNAAVYPENPNIPNVNTQFASSNQPGGFKSVFTSSSSQTSNVNGQQKTVQQASTIVNDNGNITTYTVKNP